MKAFRALIIAITQVLLAQAKKNPPGRFPDKCTFTLSSGGAFSCPAGRLEDGQIRLNGSYPTTEFSIVNGGITDEAGFGCIITGKKSVFLNNFEP